MDESFDNTLLAAWVELCKVQGAIADLSNSPSRPLRAEAETIQQLISCESMLRQWDIDLSDHLRWQPLDLSVRAPNLCVLQMMYCITLITLHRPQAGFSTANPQLGHTALAFDHADSANTVTSRKVCRDFAIRGAMLLEQFQRIYGPKHTSTLMIRITFVVATTLVLHILAAAACLENSCSEERKCLKFCLAFLESLATQFPIGVKASQALQTLLQHCGIESASGEPQANPPIQKSQAAELNLFVNDDWMAFLPLFDDRVGLDSQALFNSADAFATA